MKRTIKALTIASLMLVTLFALTACGGGGSKTEPYIKKVGFVNHATSGESASVRITMVNPTDAEWEIVVRFSATLTWKSGSQQSVVSNTTFKLTPKQTLEDGVRVTWENLLSNGTLKKFKHNIEIVSSSVLQG